MTELEGRVESAPSPMWVLSKRPMWNRVKERGFPPLWCFFVNISPTMNVTPPKLCDN